MVTLRTLMGILGAAAVVLAPTACGDPPLQPRGDGTSPGLPSGDAVASDLGGGDAAPVTDATQADGPADGAVLASDVGMDDGKAADSTEEAGPVGDANLGDQSVGDSANTADTGAVDSGPVDFALVSTSPAAGATDVPTAFQLKLKFTTGVKAASATSFTISVKSAGGQVLPCTFATAGDEVTVTAKQPAPLASRVDVVLGPLLQSVQGAPLQETSVSFYTAGPSNLQGYSEAAARFAPIVRQAVAGPADYLRRLDLDENWQASDNLANQNKFTTTAEAVWAAVETRSHLYLTWVFYWPERKGVAPGVPLHNDVAGLQVVVERQSGLPVAALTWFKAKTDEPMWLWVAAETGWPSKSNYIRAFVPRDQLFPPVASDPACQQGAADPALCPRRFFSYLTAASHQSCWWNDLGQQADQQCVATALVKASLKLLIYSPGAAATEPGLATAEGTPATYALRPLLGSWWLHRDEAGDSGLFADTQFKYSPADGRPPGSGQPLGSRLQSSIDSGDFGRPPWAWQWHPTALSASYYDLPRGMPFLDPAWVLYNRLGGTTGGPAPWNPTTKTGFSTDYCFNPYLGIDLRDTPECQP